MLPRGNIVLYNKIIFHDARLRMYERDMRIIDKGSDLAYLALRKEITDRVHGTAGKHGEAPRQLEPTFVLTTRDGSEVPVLPKRVGAGSTPAAASAEDAMILGLQPVRI